jgi:putative ABC transport system ATP-binding protein
MIEIDDLEGVHFRLPRTAVLPGELVAVVAPSVACAHEFVDLMLGLATPRRGTVRLFGETMDELDDPGRLALRARLGFAGQSDGLVSYLALCDNIMLGAAYHQGRNAQAVDARVKTFLNWSGWTDDAAREAFRRKPEQATPFERSTAVWMRALLGEPDLLVCENLFLGLDADQRRRLIEASVSFLAENPLRGSVFVLVGESLVDELQPTSMFYLSLRGDFRAESQS